MLVNGLLKMAALHRLTRTSSAAATESEAESVWDFSNHEKCGRTAGSRRLQRLVR